MNWTKLISITMEYKLVYFDEALEDLKEAKRWYKNQQTGLENRFSKLVKNAIVSILKTPEINAIRYQKIRFQRVEKFPYVVHYYIDNETNSIVITAVIHTSRHPGVAQSRL